MIRTVSASLMITLMSFSVSAAMAKEKVELKVGDAAPSFSVKDDQGKVWKSEDHVGKKILVVYFYPADMTGGCTKQACGFRDDMSKLRSADVEVVGVSGDSVKNHQLFKKVHDLNFTLLADEEGTVARKFGVTTKAGATISKLIDGEATKLTRGVTTARWTFIIGKDGKIAHKNTSVKAAADSKAVMEVVKKLN